MIGLAAVVPQVAEKIATYSAVDLVTILKEVGILITAIISGAVLIIATLRNGRKTEQLGEKTEKLSVAVVGDDKTVGLKQQVAHIEQSTNSTLTAAASKIDQLLVKLEAQEAMIRELRSERDKKELAVATATVPPGAKPAEPTINMEVDEMNVQEFNAPKKDEGK